MRSNRGWFTFGLVVALLVGVSRRGDTTSAGTSIAATPAGSCCRDRQKGNDDSDAEDAGSDNGSVQSGHQTLFSNFGNEGDNDSNDVQGSDDSAGSNDESVGGNQRENGSEEANSGGEGGE
jgi:hypothetical protein